MQLVDGATTYGSISINWQPDFTTYEVQLVESELYENSKAIKKMLNAINGVHVKQTRDNSVTFYELAHSHRYTVEAFVVGAPEGGDTVSAITLSPPPLEAPTNQQVVQVGNHLVFSWDHDSTFGTFYIRDSTGEHLYRSVSSIPAQWEIPSDGYEQYDFRIHSFYLDRQSGPTPDLSITPVMPTGFIPILDDFTDTSTWNVESSIGPGIDSFNNYKFTIYQPRGELESYGLISGDGLSSEFAITKEFSLANFNATDNLYLILDYRATSDEDRTETTTGYLQITTTAGEILYDTNMCSCALTDSGWRTYTKEISDFVQGHDSVIL